MSNILLDPADLKIESFNCGSALQPKLNGARITHVPSGLVGSCGTERSFHKNKERAYDDLCRKIFEANVSTDVDFLDEENPLWLVNEQIKGLLVGDGASEDHEDVLAFFRRTGLPEGTINRIHCAITCSEKKPITKPARNVKIEFDTSDAFYYVKTLVGKQWKKRSRHWAMHDALLSLLNEEQGKIIELLRRVGMYMCKSPRNDEEAKIAAEIFSLIKIKIPGDNDVGNERRPNQSW